MEQQNSPQAITAAPDQQRISDEDEIDLRDLLRTLLKQKKILLYTALAVFLAAVLYGLLATPVYRASITYLPPSNSDIVLLNILDSTGTDTVFKEFEKKLTSVQIRRVIFNQLELANRFAPEAKPEDHESIFSQFNKQFEVSKPDPKKTNNAPPTLSLSLTGQEADLIANVLNTLGQKAEQDTTDEFIKKVLGNSRTRQALLEKDIELLKAKMEQLKQDKIEQLQEQDRIARSNIDDQIKTLRANAKNRRMDRIQRLKEAANIAQSMGLVERSALLETGGVQAQTGRGPSIEINTQAQPLYLRGSKALNAEIKQLAERESDDPFITGLRDLQDKLALLENNRQIEALLERDNNDAFIAELREKENALAKLKSIVINPQDIKVAILDQPAYSPVRPEKPKRSLILALGMVLGLFLGIIAAFMANFWQGFRQEEAQASVSAPS